MEDGGDQIGWVWGWSGVGWWSVAARSVTLSKRENKINVFKMSSVLGESRTRSILGGLVLSGDDLDYSVDELPALTPISLSGFTLISLSLSLSLSLPFSLSLSTFSVCKMLFEGKTTMEMVLRVREGILRSKCKTFSILPYFQLVPNTHNGVKCFSELVFM